MQFFVDKLVPPPPENRLSRQGGAVTKMRMGS